MSNPNSRLDAQEESLQRVFKEINAVEVGVDNVDRQLPRRALQRARRAVREKALEKLAPEFKTMQDRAVQAVSEIEKLGEIRAQAASEINKLGEILRAAWVAEACRIGLKRNRLPSGSEISAAVNRGILPDEQFRKQRHGNGKRHPLSASQ